jgi:hypothetical protein
MAGRFDSFADGIVQRVNAMREDYARDADFRRRVKRLPSGSVGQHGTRILAGELLAAFLETKAGVDRSDAVDVCHAIVAVSYCDLVLLDGRWAAQVDTARKRIPS